MLVAGVGSKQCGQRKIVYAHRKHLSSEGKLVLIVMSEEVLDILEVRGYFALSWRTISEEAKDQCSSNGVLPTRSPELHQGLSAVLGKVTVNLPSIDEEGHSMMRLVC